MILVDNDNDNDNDNSNYIKQQQQQQQDVLDEKNDIDDDDDYFAPLVVNNSQYNSDKQQHQQQQQQECQKTQQHQHKQQNTYSCFIRLISIFVVVFIVFAFSITIQKLIIVPNKKSTQTAITITTPTNYTTDTLTLTTLPPTKSTSSATIISNFSSSVHVSTSFTQSSSSSVSNSISRNNNKTIPTGSSKRIYYKTTKSIRIKNASLNAYKQNDDNSNDNINNTNLKRKIDNENRSHIDNEDTNTENNTNTNSNNDINTVISIVNHMKQQLDTNVQKLITKLKYDYGEKIFNTIFVDTTTATAATTTTTTHSNNNTKKINKKKKKNKQSSKYYKSSTKYKYRASLLFQQAEVDGTSYERLYNKIKIQLLQSLFVQLDQKRQKQQQQQQQQQEQSSFSSSTSSMDDNNNTKIQFLWVTGGQQSSSSSKSGNYYYESYTSILESNMKSILHNSIGINFIGRNYVMDDDNISSNTTGSRTPSLSGPEIALCFNEIFGDSSTSNTTDNIDILHWDYSSSASTSGDMNDSDPIERSILLFARALRNNIGLTGIISLFQTGQDDDNNDNSNDTNRSTFDMDIITKLLDESGGIMLQSNDTYIRDIFTNTIPNTICTKNNSSMTDNNEIINTTSTIIHDTTCNSMTDTEINEMPFYIRNFKCNNRIESGHFYCDNDKYNLLLQCPTNNRNTTMVPSHRGWKWHALIGNLISMFLIDAFQTALNELYDAIITTTTTTTTDTVTLETVQDMLSLLLNEQDGYYERFLHTIIPKQYFQQLTRIASNYTDNDTIHEIIDLMITQPNFCHRTTTTRLLSEIRNNGVVTYDTVIAPLHDTIHASASTNINSILTTTVTINSSNDTIKLVYDENEQYDCEMLRHIDHIDVLTIHANDGIQHIVFPNDDEIVKYDPNNTYSTKLVGVIGFCIRLCDGDNCSSNIINNYDILSANDTSNNEDSYYPPVVEFTINQQKASNTVIPISSNCYILTTESGTIHFPPNNTMTTNGVKFDISIKVHKKDSYLPVSSFIIW